MAGDNQNLTGVWNGLYSYSDEPEWVAFGVTLIHAGASLSGATHEVGKSWFLGRKTNLRAFISGHYSAGKVEFVKTYDGTGGWKHSVWYEGSLNGESTEIEGTWSIPKERNGRFLMIRPGAVSQVETIKTKERA